MRLPWFTVLLFTTVAAAEDPAPPILRTGANAGKELNVAQRTIVAGKVTEGVDKLRKLLDESGSELVTTDGTHYVPLQRAAQGVLLALPPAELQVYRERINGPAAALLAAGKSDLDPRPLLKLVERYFASASTEEALLLLAELALAQGDFRSADSHWRRLLPADAGSAELSLPLVKTPAATVRSRILLAALCDGQLERVKNELPAFRKEHPQAVGRLAGETGDLADILQRKLDAGQEPPVSMPPRGDWPMLGGDAGRSGRASCRLPRFWSARPAWDMPLRMDTGTRAMPAGRPVNARAAAVHPVVWDGIAYVADAGAVVGFEAATGVRRFFHEHREAGEETTATNDKPTTTVDTEFPLTVAEEQLFARLGSTAIPAQAVEGKPGVPMSWIVAFGKTRDANGNFTLKKLWQLSPPVPDGVSAAWEAAPVVHRGRMYLAFTMEAKSGLVQAIACYPLSNAHPGKPFWIAEVADLPIAGNAQIRRRPEPLAVAGETIVLCTHAGAVVAVDASTGKPAWGYIYPKPAKLAAVYRDVNPPVVSGGRVFVAPTDSDRLFALDVVSGMKLWDVEGIQVDQLLGVAGGKIIAALAAPQRGLRGFDVLTGSDREPRGWAIHDDPWLASYGRGLVTDDAVLWPTKSGIFFVRPTDGLPLPARLPGPQGNLALADGILVVGTADGVRAFAPKQPRNPEARELTQAQRTRVFAEQAMTYAATPAGHADFRKGHPDVAEHTDEFVLNRDGIPTRLKHVLAAHFHLPFDAAPPTADAGELPAAMAPTRFGEVPLPNSRCIPLKLSGDRLPGHHPVSDAESLHLVAIGNEKAIWSSSLPPAAGFTQCIASGNALFLVGPHTVAKFHSADGRRAWVADWPDSLPLGIGTVAMIAGEAAAADFRNPRIVGRRLILKSGASLVAIDTETGEYVWVNRPTGKWTTASHAGRSSQPMGELAPRWADAFYADSTVLLAHNGAEEARALDPATGALLGKLRSSDVPWSTPPVQLEDKLVALPAGPGFDYGLVSLVEFRGGKREPLERRRKQTAGETSLTGSPPILLAGPNAALVFTVRNIGLEVTLMKSTSGTDDPSRGALIPVPSIDPAACAVDSERAYVPAGGKLWSFRWSDGTRAFDPVTLGQGDFAAHRIGNRIVCIGTQPTRSRSRLVAFNPTELLATMDHFSNGTVPLVVLDAATTRVVSTQAIPVCGPHVVHAGGNFVAVLSVGRSVLVKLPL